MSCKSILTSARSALICVIALALIALLPSAPAVAQIWANPITQADLDAAIANWNAAGVDTYTYSYQDLGYWDFEEVTTVTVVNGQVATAISGTGAEAWSIQTIPGVFDSLQAALDSSEAGTVSATFDPNTGRPLSYYIDWIATAIDDERRRRFLGYVESAQPITCAGLRVTVLLTEGPDRFTPFHQNYRSAGPMVIAALGGDDVIGLSRHSHQEVICGGSGNDEIRTGGGDDLVLGEAGNDQLFGEAGNDRLFGGFGSDVIVGLSGADFLHGGPGSDQLMGGLGADKMLGSSGADRIWGSGGFDDIFGGTGADRIWGGSGLDIIRGELGDDRINGGAHADRIWGGEGNDVIAGAGGHDNISGGVGDDIISGGIGIDICRGGPGSDSTTACP